MRKSLRDLKLSKDEVALCIAGSRDIRATLAGPLIDHYTQPIIDRLGAIFVGDARGVDRTAYSWALMHNIPCVQFAANWSDEGKAAGVLRNERMVTTLLSQQCALQGLVIRYADSKGSKDTLRRLRKLGIPVWDIALPRPPQVGNECK